MGVYPTSEPKETKDECEDLPSSTNHTTGLRRHQSSEGSQVTIKAQPLLALKRRRISSHTGIQARSLIICKKVLYIYIYRK